MLFTPKVFSRFPNNTRQIKFTSSSVFRPNGRTTLSVRLFFVLTASSKYCDRPNEFYTPHFTPSNATTPTSPIVPGFFSPTSCQFIVGYGGCGGRELPFFVLNIAQDDPMKRVVITVFNHPVVLTASLGLVILSALSAQAANMKITPLTFSKTTTSTYLLTRNWTFATGGIAILSVCDY